MQPSLAAYPGGRNSLVLLEIDMELTVEFKIVYGVDTVYPVCDKAKFFAALAGTKTLTPQAVKLIKQQGYTFRVAGPKFI